MKTLKKKIYYLLNSDVSDTKASKLIDIFFIILISLNVVSVIADTFKLPERIVYAFSVFETFSVIAFSIEYVLRLFTASLNGSYDSSSIKPYLKYFFSPMALIDLLSILPFYLPFFIALDLRVLRALKLIKLLRILKFNRYTDALSTIFNVLKNKKEQLISSFLIIFLLMVMASVLMFSVENEAQPEVFKNAFSALWWAIATVTTVGYGDIYPVTVVGKLLSAVIAFLGVGLVAVPTGIISAGFGEVITSSNSNISDVYNSLSDENKIAVNKYIEYLKDCEDE